MSLYTAHGSSLRGARESHSLLATARTTATVAESTPLTRDPFDPLTPLTLDLPTLKKTQIFVPPHGACQELWLSLLLLLQGVQSPRLALTSTARLKHTKITTDATD